MDRATNADVLDLRAVFGLEARITAETLDRLARAGRVRSTRDLRSLIYMSMSAVKHRPDVPGKPPFWW